MGTDNPITHIVLKENLMPAKQTAWTVVTGAPCAGKTTTVQLLGTRGFHVNSESSRRHIGAQIQLGRTIAGITADWLIFLSQIYAIQSVMENEMDPDRPSVLDRSLVDSLAYRRFRGVDASMFPAVAGVRRYRHVFVLERLTFTSDGVRLENDALAAEIHLQLLRAYSEMGYKPVVVPVLPLTERVQWILGHM